MDAVLRRPSAARTPGALFPAVRAGPTAPRDQKVAESRDHKRRHCDVRPRHEARSKLYATDRRAAVIYAVRGPRNESPDLERSLFSVLYSLTAGVRQGGVLSPFLFAVFICCFP